jgi:hypothetical protein
MNLVALDQLRSSQHTLILHNKKPTHVLQKQEELNVKFHNLNADKMLCVAVCKPELTRCEICPEYGGRQTE